jgi:hypothetical protein
LALDVLLPFSPTPAVAEALPGWQRPLLLLPALGGLFPGLQFMAGDESWFGRLRQGVKGVGARMAGVILAATLVYIVGLILVWFPLDGLPRFWLWLGMGIAVLALGMAVAVLDARDEGEVLWPHFWRALDYSFFTALLFGGQVGLVMAFSTGVTLPLLLLLLTTITAALVIQTFSDTFQSLLDNIAFFKAPRMQQLRAEMRVTAAASARLNEALDLAALDEAEFANLTRRALAHMGDLPKLATSPLTRLPLVEARLKQKGGQTTTLERAAELKAILTESIGRLKPLNKGEFGTADEWRHYNALYYPYVAGLKPYSRRAAYDGRETTFQQALAWFRDQVPERTLYNWQKAAARLVAQDLREQSGEGAKEE